MSDMTVAALPAAVSESVIAPIEEHDEPQIANDHSSASTDPNPIVVLNNVNSVGTVKETIVVSFVADEDKENICEQQQQPPLSPEPSPDKQSQDPFVETLSLASKPQQVADMSPSSNSSTPNTHFAKKRGSMTLGFNKSKLRQPFKSPMKKELSEADPPRFVLPATPTSKLVNKTQNGHSTGRGVKRSLLDADNNNCSIDEEEEPLESNRVTPQRPTLRPKNSNPPFRSSFTSSASGSPMHRDKMRKGILIDVTKVKDPELHALQQKHNQLLNTLKSTKAAFDAATQASKIEQSGEDDRLEELIVKWRDASQSAADVMFDQVAERVSRMGGASAFKQMQERSNDKGDWGFVEEEQVGMNGEDQVEVKKQQKERYEAEYGVEELRMMEQAELKESKTSDKEDEVCELSL